MSDPTVLYEVREGVARITLNMPERHNAISPDLVTGLNRATLACVGDRSIRAVLLCAKGSNFCVGGDLRVFAPRFQDETAPGFLEELANSFHEGVLRLANWEVPKIVAVHGAVAGGGLGLMLTSDLVVADRTATFTVAYAGIGLSTDGGVSHALPRAVGPRRAVELALTNRTVDADEATRIGLVDLLVEGTDLDASAERWARQLASGPTWSYRTIKRLISESETTTLEAHLNLEAALIGASARSRDGGEGIAAFVGKRAPDFTGTPPEGFSLPSTGHS